jgi:hypothetical protein
LRLALDEWAEGRPRFLSIFAHHVALSFDSCWKVCELAAHNERIDGDRALVPTGQWIGFYKNHRRVSDKLEHLFRADWLASELSASERDLEEIELWWTRLQSLSGEDRRKKIAWDLYQRFQQRALAMWERNYQYHIAGIEAQLRSPVWNRGLAEKRFSCPEVLFFFRVAVPCWLEYGTAPVVLFREARKGKIDALTRLVSLDPYCIEDDLIRAAVFHARIVGTDKDRKALDRAFAYEGRKAIKRSRLKVHFASLVYKAFAEFDAVLRELDRKFPFFKHARVKLNAPDVQRLFDAAAKDMHGTEIDPDFAETTPHAFYTMIKRDLGFWRVFS